MNKVVSNAVLGVLWLGGLAQFASATSLQNVNLDQPAFYDNLEASELSINTNQHIRPFSYRRAEPFLPDLDRLRRFPDKDSLDEGALWKVAFPSSMNARVLYTNEEASFLEGQSGLSLRNGANVLAFEDGYINYADEIILYLQLKQVVNQKTMENQLFRGYLKMGFGKWSLELGKDNVSIGPGEYGGLLLSNNAEPYSLVKLATEEPVNFLGDWDFVFMQAWLNQKRQDHSNPKLLAAAASFKPFNWIELGLVRTELFGGDNRPGYSLTEYPQILLGSGDNISGDRFDNDGYLSINVSVYFPLQDIFPGVRTFKYYYEEAGSDIAAFWQDDPSGSGKKSDFFTLMDVSIMQGLYIATESNIFRLEYAHVTTNFYNNHNYGVEGYSYNNMALGYPYGRNTESYLFKHLHYFSKDMWGQYKIGQYQSPAFHTQIPGLTMTRSFLEVQAEKKVGIYRLSGFVRLDSTQNYDGTLSSNPIAAISDRTVTAEDKTFTTVGVSVTMDF